jgi:molybdopterin molybdotransferase
LRPQDIGTLTAIGITEVDVNSRVRVGVISSGDEIVPPDVSPPIGKLRDVNGIMLQAGVEAAGGIPLFYGIVPDSKERLIAVLERALMENDLVIVSGGSSVGTKDMTLKAMLAMPDATTLFHGLAVKPGKPTMAVKSSRGLMVGLPGHPVSAYLMFQVMVVPLLTCTSAVPVKAVLSSNAASAPGRDDFVRVTLTPKDGCLSANPVWGKSGLVRVMSKADGYFHIPAVTQGFLAGAEVEVFPF